MHGIRCLAMSASGQVHVTVVGGGAAGLTAAFFAAREGAKVRRGTIILLLSVQPIVATVTR